MNIKKIKSDLRKNLGEKRYEHTVLTAETALQLAEFYKCDIEKAELAGILHDCAKHLTTEEQLELLKDTPFSTTMACRKNPATVPIVINNRPEIISSCVSTIFLRS